jgi:hypothetical protein
MKIIGNFIAGICAVLLVISGVIALLSFNIERKAFSSNTYKQAFEDQNLYERMPDVLAVALSASITNSGNTNPLLNLLSTEDWRTSIAALLPPEELKAITDNALDATFNYLDGKTDSAVVFLTPLKGYLISDGGVEAVTQLLQAQPDCTTEQLTQIALGLLSGGDLLLCNPPQEVMGFVTPLIESQLQVMTLGFPDEVTLISGEKSNTPDDPRIRINRLRAVMKLTPAFPLLFLLAIAIFAVRSLREWLIWWGVPITLTGGVSLLIALLGAPTVGFVIGRVMQNQASSFMPPILLETMQETAREVAREILNPVAIEGALLLLIGLGMTGVALFFTKKGKV